MPYTRIVILDPESSDPTWGTLDDSLILHVLSEDMQLIESGELSVTDMIERYRKHA